jgi:hypothetical protein
MGVIPLRVSLLRDALDRCRDAPPSDLADHAALGQDLPAGLVVVAGVQVHHRPGRQGPDHADGVEGGRQQPVVAAVGRGGHRPSGMPPASVTIERLRPCLRRSVGLGPAVWPPQGALVMHPSTLRCSNSKPNSRSSAASTARRSPVGHPGGDPRMPAAAQGDRRAGGVGDAAVARSRPPGPGWACRRRGGRGCGGGGSPAGGSRRGRSTPPRGRKPRRIPSDTEMVGCNGSGRPLTSVSAGQSGVEPPAGIEPATPSLPSMRGWFAMPCSTSRTRTTAQVRGAAEGWVMGRCEVACSAVSDKSLAGRPPPPCALTR